MGYARTLGYQALIELYRRTPGLALDKLKAVVRHAWRALSQSPGVRGIVFAYDEAQNLADQPAKDQSASPRREPRVPVSRTPRPAVPSRSRPPTVGTAPAFVPWTDAPTGKRRRSVW